MATSVIPYESMVPDERLLRIPDIHADLLPIEVFEGRRARKVRTVVIGALVAFAALLFGWYGVATYQVHNAQNGLTTAQDQARSLTREQGKFTTLVSTQGQIKTVGAQLTELMADDLSWSTLIASLYTAAPTGVVLNTLTGTVQTATSNTAATGTELPSSSEYMSIGTVSLGGTAPSKPVVAAYVDALGKVKGVSSPLLSSLTLNDKGVANFAISMDVTTDARGGRYNATPTPSVSGK